MLMTSDLMMATNFAGMDLTYVPDRTYRNLWGVTVGSSYTKEFANGLQLAASASFRDLPHNAADRFIGDVSAYKKLGKTPWDAKIGVTRFGQIGQSYTLPYVQAGYTLPLSAHRALRPNVTVGYYAADAGSGTSGWQADAFLPVVFAPNPVQFFAVGPTVLKHSVGYEEQSYTSVGLRAVSAIRTTLVNVEVGTQARITRFDAIDPFWGERRKDKNIYGTAMVSSDKVRIGPFQPAVGVSCSFTDSAIKYYKIGGCEGQFEVRKLF